jgi:hypothetical protein
MILLFYSIEVPLGPADFSSLTNSQVRLSLTGARRYRTLHFAAVLTPQTLRGTVGEVPLRKAVLLSDGHATSKINFELTLAFSTAFSSVRERFKKAHLLCSAAEASFSFIRYRFEMQSFVKHYHSLTGAEPFLRSRQL